MQKSLLRSVGSFSVNGRTMENLHRFKSFRERNNNRVTGNTCVQIKKKGKQLLRMSRRLFNLQCLLQVISLFRASVWLMCTLPGSGPIRATWERWCVDPSSPHSDPGPLSAPLTGSLQLSASPWEHKK